jgi:L-gulonolactone oxidase
MARAGARAWTNWSQEHTCAPAVRARPESVAEVAELVRDAAHAGRTVRVAGAGHSFTPCVLTDGALLSLERMDRVLDVDHATGLVRVEAGISLRACSEALAAHGLAFENLGDIDVQSIAGATATGTHGTGTRLRNLSSALHAVQLVTADGSVCELDEQRDPDAWRAARVSIGALGVVTAVTLRTVPAFTLRGVEKPMPLAEVLPRLDELADGNDHFEFFVFPHSPLALTKTNTRVDEPPRPRSPALAFLHDELMTNRAFDLACRVGRARPSWIPAINRIVSRASGTTVRVDRSDRIYASPRKVRFTEMEYAIPREHARRAVEAVLAMVPAREFAVPFPLEVRFVAADDAFLSPATGRDTAYLAAHMYNGMPWVPYLRAVEEILAPLGGRPHWGKRHFRTAADLRPAYPDWDRFQAVRDRLDPERVFTNRYVADVLGA